MKTLSEETLAYTQEIAELLVKHFGQVEVVGHRFWARWKKTNLPGDVHVLHGTIGSVCVSRKDNGEMWIYLIPVGVSLENTALFCDPIQKKEQSALKNVFAVTNKPNLEEIYIPGYFGEGWAQDVELVIDPL